AQSLRPLAASGERPPAQVRKEFFRAVGAVSGGWIVRGESVFSQGYSPVRPAACS
ncbi:hypothetical protein NPIL_448041, partial [Nephila pilipes]